MRYVGVFLEVTAVSALVLGAARYFEPLYALTGPPSTVWLFFIVLAVLRLDWLLCVFTGALAGLEYLLLAAFLAPGFQDAYAGTIFSLAGPFLARAMSYVLLGVLAGAVAHEVQRRFLSSVQLYAERKRVMDLFGQQVSPEVANKLLQQKSELLSETRSVCVMFLDIRDFTTFSEMRGPEEVVEYLNVLFDSLIEGVNTHGGFINKFLGDGFMAVFGAPVSDGRDSRNAVESALELLARVDELVRSGRIPATRVGIGLHKGPAVVGNVGSQLRREYTIIGDVVNTAARIEALNKRFQSALLVSEQVWQDLGETEIEGELMEPVPVKGRQELVRLVRLA